MMGLRFCLVVVVVCRVHTSIIDTSTNFSQFGKSRTPTNLGTIDGQYKSLEGELLGGLVFLQLVQLLHQLIEVRRLLNLLYRLGFISREFAVAL